MARTSHIKSCRHIFCFCIKWFWIQVCGRKTNLLWTKYPLFLGHWFFKTLLVLIFVFVMKFSDLQMRTKKHGLLTPFPPSSLMKVNVPVEPILASCVCVAGLRGGGRSLSSGPPSPALREPLSCFSLSTYLGPVLIYPYLLLPMCPNTLRHCIKLCSMDHCFVRC